jgi:hypothetical protein
MFERAESTDIGWSGHRPLARSTRDPYVPVASYSEPALKISLRMQIYVAGGF